MIEKKREKGWQVGERDKKDIEKVSGKQRYKGERYKGWRDADRERAKDKK